MAAEASLADSAEKLPRQLSGEAGANAASLGAGSGGDEEPRWSQVLDLPCELTVDLSLPAFTIADLLKIRGGSVINAHWRVVRDVPLRVNGTLIGWTEFEIVGNSLAVRLTELA